MGGKTIRVLLVDQQRLFRESLALVLSRLPDIATVEHTGSVVEASQRLAPVDIAVIGSALFDNAKRYRSLPTNRVRLSGVSRHANGGGPGGPPPSLQRASTRSGS